MDKEKNTNLDLISDLNDLFGIEDTDKTKEIEKKELLDESAINYDNFYAESKKLYQSFSTICKSLMDIMFKVPEGKLEIVDYSLIAFNLIEDMSSKYYELFEDIEKYINTHNDCSNITIYIENSLKKYTQILKSIENVLNTKVHVEVINKKFIFILNKIYLSFLSDITTAKKVINKYIEYNVQDSINEVKKFKI